jgi:hypothetical protein
MLDQVSQQDFISPFIFPVKPAATIRALVHHDKPEAAARDIARRYFESANQAEYARLAARTSLHARLERVRRRAERFHTLEINTTPLVCLPSRETAVPQASWHKMSVFLAGAASLLLVFSAWNAATVYVVESAGWDILTRYPLLAAAFALVVPGAGLAGLFGFNHSFVYEASRRRFMFCLSAVCLISVLAWVAGVLNLHAAADQLLSIIQGDNSSDVGWISQRSAFALVFTGQVIGEIAACALSKFLVAAVARRSKRFIVLPNPLWAQARDAAEFSYQEVSEVELLVEVEKHHAQALTTALDGYSTEWVTEVRAAAVALKCAKEAAALHAEAAFLSSAGD